MDTAEAAAKVAEKSKANAEKKLRSAEQERFHGWRWARARRKGGRSVGIELWRWMMIVGHGYPELAL